MQGNSWRDESYDELEPIGSLLSDLSESLAEEEPDHRYDRGLAGRRRKAAVALSVIWGSTVALHLVSWGLWFVVGLTMLLSLHVLRVVLFARPLSIPPAIDRNTPEDYPYISLLVAAKNEEAVIESLVQDLCNLDYPDCRYDLWVIDDNSSDRTGEILDRLATVYPQLQVVHRPANAGGGKSGALNQVLPFTQGDLIAVFDADAQVPQNLLRQVVPLFDRAEIGAVQVRKAITNAATNFWTRGQTAEMVFDSFMQQQRIAIGGIGELRGNGQFVRRSALKGCGGWNEQTITDDLDLTLKLHLDRWEIDFLALPAVGEEGVTTAKGLWHQRNRWAEGGYQRYLDYWRWIIRGRLGRRKTIDLLVFWMTQYVLPTASVPDFLMALVRSTPPILLPVTSVTMLVSLFGMMAGFRRYRGGRLTPMMLFQALYGTFYMLHWLPIISSTTTRMAFRPKRLKWVKTLHHGESEVWAVPKSS